jgi:hypothetical protein
MVIIGGLRLVSGLVFLGTVIASCLWFLNRLFPGPSDTSYHWQDDVSRPTYPTQPTTAAREQKQRETSGVAQDPRPQEGGKVRDERITR